MAANNILTKWAIWVDGIGKAGNAKSYTPPELNVITKDFQSGDMDMAIPLDVGMEPMQASFSLFGIDPFVIPLLGFRQGTRTAVSVRSTYTDREGNTFDVVEELGGLISKIKRDDMDTGDQSDKAMTVEMKLDFYKVVRSGVVLLEVDPENGTRKLGGIDVLEGVRAILQLA